MTTDAIVTFDDALLWAADLVPRKADELLDMFGAEPALAGVAANLADRIAETVTRLGYPQPHASIISGRVLHAALVMAEITRRGYQQFNHELLPPPQKGGEQ